MSTTTVIELSCVFLVATVGLTVVLWLKPTLPRRHRPPEPEPEPGRHRAPDDLPLVADDTAPPAQPIDDRDQDHADWLHELREDNDK